MSTVLRQMQLERDKWVARNFPDDQLVNSILGATEEIGELSHHYLKWTQGIRGTEEDHKAGMLDAVADCVIFLAGVCSHLGVNYETLVQGTWSMVQKRDWLADAAKGGEIAAPYSDEWPGE